MLLSCMVVYLIFAVPAFVLIWTSLIAAKNGDQAKDEDDLEGNTSSELNLLIRSVEIE